MGHKLDDDLLVTSHLEERMADEAAFESGKEDAGFWSIRQRSGGPFIVRARGYEAAVPEQMFARFLCEKLNGEIAMDGAWVTAWTDRGKRFIMLWLDADGDVQFTVECDSLEEMLADRHGNAIPWETWVEQAMQAWQQWHEKMRLALAPTEGQLFKRAKGQLPGSIVNPSQWRH